MLSMKDLTSFKSFNLSTKPQLSVGIGLFTLIFWFIFEWLTAGRSISIIFALIGGLCLFSVACFVANPSIFPNFKSAESGVVDESNSSRKNGTKLESRPQQQLNPVNRRQQHVTKQQQDNMAFRVRNDITTFEPLQTPPIVEAPSSPPSGIDPFLSQYSTQCPSTEMYCSLPELLTCRSESNPLILCQPPPSLDTVCNMNSNNSLIGSPMASNEMQSNVFVDGSQRQKPYTSEYITDQYLLNIPIPELIKFFHVNENSGALEEFYKTLRKSADILSPSVAADLLRLPVKLNRHDIKITKLLADRLLSFTPEQRNLSSMQIALVCWSLAKTPNCYLTSQHGNQSSYNCLSLFNSIAAEALMKYKKFQPLSIANLFWAFGKLKYQDPLLMSKLAEVATVELQQFNAQNVANVYWALGTLELRSTDLTPNPPSDTSLVVSTLIDKLKSFNSQALANFVWACAKLHWNAPQLMTEAAQVALHKIHEFKSQEIANLMWGLAKLNTTDADFAVEVFANRAAMNLKYFNSQEVSNAYWALGTLELRGTALTPMNLSIPVPITSSQGSDIGGYFNSSSSSSLPTNHLPHSSSEFNVIPTTQATPSTQETLDGKQSANPPPLGVTPDSQELLDILLKKMELFNAQAVANFLWACGRLQWKCPTICDSCRHIIQRNIKSFRPQNTANVLWALAKLKVRDIGLLHLLCEAALEQLDNFNPQEIANIFWALGILEIKDSVLTPVKSMTSLEAMGKFRQSKNVIKISSSIRSKLRQFKPQELANLLWGCARLRWRQEDLLNEAAEAALLSVRHFKPQEIGNFVWALAKLNYKQTDLIHSMCEFAAYNIRYFTPQNIANVYWAIGSLSYSQSSLSTEQPNKEFLSGLLSVMQKFNAQEIANFLWACGRLRWEQKDVLDMASRLVLKDVERFRKQELLNLHWAFRKLNRHEIVKSINSALICRQGKSVWSNNVWSATQLAQQI